MTPPRSTLATSLVALREMDMRFWSGKATEELMGLGHLFIVARHNVDLYEYLTREFAGEPVAIVLDRRKGERRRGAAAPPAEERRCGDRRQPGAEEALRVRGFVVVPESRPRPEGTIPQ